MLGGRGPGGSAQRSGSTAAGVRGAGEGRGGDRESAARLCGSLLSQDLVQGGAREEHRAKGDHQHPGGHPEGPGQSTLSGSPGAFGALGGLCAGADGGGLELHPDEPRQYEDHDGACGAADRLENAAEVRDEEGGRERGREEQDRRRRVPEPGRLDRRREPAQARHQVLDSLTAREEVDRVRDDAVDSHQQAGDLERWAVCRHGVQDVALDARRVGEVAKDPDEAVSEEALDDCHGDDRVHPSELPAAPPRRGDEGGTQVAGAGRRRGRARFAGIVRLRRRRAAAPLSQGGPPAKGGLVLELGEDLDHRCVALEGKHHHGEGVDGVGADPDELRLVEDLRVVLDLPQAHGNYHSGCVRKGNHRQAADS
mmetsp:Transcript_41652/g.98759  ORF Transcript_41652/g.98759 Transcript_41652/m.98759 type:complete len:368 (-) Transcript_41652:666-1769(-)